MQVYSTTKPKKNEKETAVKIRDKWRFWLNAHCYRNIETPGTHLRSQLSAFGLLIPAFLTNESSSVPGRLEFHPLTHPTQALTVACDQGNSRWKHSIVKESGNSNPLSFLCMQEYNGLRGFGALEIAFSCVKLPQAAPLRSLQRICTASTSQKYTASSWERRQDECSQSRICIDSNFNVIPTKEPVITHSNFCKSYFLRSVPLIL